MMKKLLAIAGVVTMLAGTIGTGAVQASTPTKTESVAVTPYVSQSAYGVTVTPSKTYYTFGIDRYATINIKNTNPYDLEIKYTMQKLVNGTWSNQAESDGTYPTWDTYTAGSEVGWAFEMKKEIGHDIWTAGTYRLKLEIRKVGYMTSLGYLYSSSFDVRG